MQCLIWLLIQRLWVIFLRKLCLLLLQQANRCRQQMRQRLMRQVN